MADSQSNHKNASKQRSLRLEAETFAAVAGTLFAASLLILNAVNSGPLWRDEINTANVAQMPSLRNLWHNLSCESFPPLWPLLLRGCSLLGLVGSDVSIRLVGLYAGLFVLGSLWLCARWLGCRAPILSIGLLGCLPAFVFIVGANRAYGLASGLLLLSLGTVWRMLEVPSRGRILAAGVVCFLFAHCVYYDVVFLAAILAGGALVALRRRQVKTLAALTVIGVISAASLVIYLPIIRQGSAYVPMMQWPYFSFRTLWDKLGDTVTARASGELGHNGPEIWLWIALLLGGLAAAVAAQQSRVSSPPDTTSTTPVTQPRRADLALFCATSMTLGVVGLLAFLYRLHYWTEPWYYIEMLCLCGISLDGLLGANWPALRPWGLLRIGFMVAMMAWCGRAGWQEAHTRRSDMDLIATVLNQTASKGDFIVVNSAWEGISFNRYYHGAAAWATVPPVDSHLVHRNDLVFEAMHRPDPMAPVLCGITNALQEGHNIWMIGNMSPVRPDSVRVGEPAKWLGTYLYYWNAQVSATILDHALQEHVLEITAGEPICCLENLPVVQFTGFRSGQAPASTGRPAN